MKIFTGIIQTLAMLITYLIIGLMLCSSPIGWYLIYLLTQTGKDKKAYYAWLLIDRLICTIVHSTYKRTISGISGQYANTKKRYKYQSKVIDFLAYKLAGELNHCAHAYAWEKQNGWVE